MTIMTHRGLKSILKERVKLGVDVDAVMISDGIGYSAESTVRLADIYSFSDNKGLFLGTSIEGSYLQPRNDLNKIVHNAELSAEDILRNNSYKKESESLKKIILRITNDSKTNALIFCAHGSSSQIHYENVKKLVNYIKNKVDADCFFCFIEKSEPNIDKFLMK